MYLAGSAYQVGPHGLRLTPNLMITPDMLPTFGGATVRPLDAGTADIALYFRGFPTYVPVTLSLADAHRGAAELGAALVRYAAPGIPAVFVSAAKPFYPPGFLPVGVVCPGCRSDHYAITGAAPFMGVEPRRCSSCGADYQPPTPLWKKVIATMLDPGAWFGA